MCRAKRRIFLFTIALALLFLAFDSAVIGQNPARDVLAAMDKFNRGLNTVRGRVTRVDENKQLKVFDTRYGKLIYAHDKKGSTKKISVRVDFEKPEESLAVQNGKYYLYAKGRNQAYEGPVSSKRGTTNGVPLTFIGMSRSELESKYAYTYLNRARLQNGEDTTHLKLTPKIKAQYSHVEIWVNDNGMPSQTKVVQTNGDSTTILISNYQIDGKIDGSEFKINIPKDANRHVEK